MDFAYTRPMEFVLSLITFTETFCSMYMISKIILTVFGLTASRIQKMLFAFINGTLMWNALIYGVYFWGGMISLSPPVYTLLTSPSPISALVFLFSAKTIFRISSVRSCKLMSYVFLFWATAKALNRLTGSIFFLQTGPRYNYLTDAMQQLTHFAVLCAIFGITLYLIRRNKSGLHFIENLFVNEARAVILYIVNASFAYAVSVVLPLAFSATPIVYAMNVLLLGMFILLLIGTDIIEHNKQSILNREIHINALFKGLEELRGIKHDLNNILHTYSGYLQLHAYQRLEKYHASLIYATSYAGSIAELGLKMKENPAVVSLFINKLEYAEKMNVKMLVSLQCDLENLYMDTLDISRVLAALLDNAIEAASESRQRKVFVTVESKPGGSKLIIVTNSTADDVDTNAIHIDGMTTKTGHDGLGLPVIRNILNKYGNCSHQSKYFDNEFSVYIDLRNNA